MSEHHALELSVLSSVKKITTVWIGVIAICVCMCVSKLNILEGFLSNSLPSSRPSPLLIVFIVDNAFWTFPLVLKPLPCLHSTNNVCSSCFQHCIISNSYLENLYKREGRISLGVISRRRNMYIFYFSRLCQVTARKVVPVHTSSNRYENNCFHSLYKISSMFFSFVSLIAKLVACCFVFIQLLVKIKYLFFHF